MKIAVLVLVGLAVVIFAVAFYFGAFRRIVVVEENSQPLCFVYREIARGELGTVGRITTELDALLGSRSTARRPLDVFFPDGHGEVGFSVEDSCGPTLSAALAASAKVREIPAGPVMRVSFPWRSPLSFWVGYLKVNPALAKHRAARHYESAEAMALTAGATIEYLQPIRAHHDTEVSPTSQD